MSAAPSRDRLVHPAVVLALTAALLAARPLPSAPAEPPPPAERRVVVGEYLAPSGTLFQREGPGKPWTVDRRQHPLPSRDLLLALPGARAELASANGAVLLTLWGNLPELSRSAVLESAVVLHDNPVVDLDFTLERGRVVFRSNKDKEPARVRVRVPGAVWELSLQEKGDEAALELYGRWPRGVGYSADPKSPEKPTLDLVFLALRGIAQVKVDKLPAWADPGAARTTEARRAREVLDQLHARLRDKPLPQALTNLFDSADDDADKAQATVTRQVVVAAWGATDDLAHLVEALADSKHAAVRHSAVEVLRHWIGRAPGQDRDLDQFLVKEAKYPPTQAEVVLQLLHSPFDPEQPETFQTLIEYLRSDRLGIRELALWHLERLAPAGRSIAFDPAGSAEAREQGSRKWKELIPDGTLPPKGK
jgi:hypothetical protein